MTDITEKAGKVLSTLSQELKGKDHNCNEGS
jgi:hypothetical protein